MTKTRLKNSFVINLYVRRMSLELLQTQSNESSVRTGDGGTTSKFRSISAMSFFISLIVAFLEAYRIWNYIS